MTPQEVIAEMREILKGIDATEVADDEGWWETSTGAEFGKGKLVELEALITRAMSA